MSFGFSVGDFVAVGSLIVDITSSLKDSGGAKSDYQELLRELECLRQALQHLDRLEPRCSPPMKESLDSIKYAALSCRKPLEDFLRNMKKFNRSLGVGTKDRGAKTVADKLRWSFGTGKRDGISRLQGYLSIHVGTINVLLAEYGLEQLDLAGQKAEMDQMLIHKRIEDTRKVLDKIQESTATQTLAVETSRSMLLNLCQMVSGEFSSSWKSLVNMVAKVCVCTQQIYGAVLRIEASLPSPDIRRTFFQEPLIIEDALGCRFPVPSEYDFDLLDGIINLRFKTGPGSRDVRLGNYELFKTKNRKEVITANTRLLPATAITMGILVSKKPSRDEHCPMPRCGSDRTSSALGGGRLCCDCNVWFDHSTKLKRKRLENLLDLVGDPNLKPSEPSERENEYEPSRKRRKLSYAEEDMNLLRNVRCAEDEICNEAARRDLELWNKLSGQRPPVAFWDAIRYVEKVKNRFVDRPEVYNKFLKTLRVTDMGLSIRWR